jgi:dihydropteroate synthase
LATLNPLFKKISDESRRRSLIMGVLNVTPDSFSDGGLYLEPSRALERAQGMMDEGADVLYLGGESTRPGATAVSLEEELRRVMPVAEALAKSMPGLAWSIDTSKAKVAEEALKLGACMVNDVSALRQDEAMAPLVARSGCGAVLMHRLDSAQRSEWSTQESSRYGEEGVVAAVRKFLTNRASSLLMEGLSKQQFWLDPGFGFGKSVEDNLSLMKGLPELVAAGYPLLLGTSRKSTLGAVLGGAPESDRLEASLATAALAAFHGVACLRVHDVKACARVVKVVQAIKSAAGPKSAPSGEIRPIHPFRGGLTPGEEF